MRKPWHRGEPGLLEKLAAEVRVDYPNLHFYPEGDRVFVRGTFPVVHDGAILDRYVVEVELLPDFPESIPVVREAAGRVPRTADRHMNEKGDACVFLPDERWETWPKGATLLDFLSGPVRNFFLGQSLVELGDPWPFGQHAHGAGGIREYYGTLLGTTDAKVILGYLECLSRPILKGHWDCPCGSGRRLRDCHRIQIEDLRAKIPTFMAKRSVEALRPKMP